jgi:hypothetical protein
MAEFVLTAAGATITIQNTSVDKTLYAANEGFISPTLVSTGNVEAPQTIKAGNIQVPSFLTYKINKIAPGDTLTFVSTKVDEILYYKDLAQAGIEGFTVTVTPIGE